MLVLSVAFGDSISEGNVAALEIQFGFRWRAKYPRPSVVEFAFPARDDGRCQTIADDVHACAAHVHQFIDPEDNGEPIGPNPAGTNVG